MNQTQAFNQNGFIGILPAPNNMGVCFSLSVHWLANNCENVMLNSIADASVATYGGLSDNRANQIQNAANSLAAGAMDFESLVAITQMFYPNLHDVSPPVNPAALTYGALFTAFGQALHQTSIIWLSNPAVAGDRGHVVAYNRDGQFFDANNGTYEQETSFYAEMASFIMHEYGTTYTHFQVFFLDIH